MAWIITREGYADDNPYAEPCYVGNKSHDWDETSKAIPERWLWDLIGDGYTYLSGISTMKDDQPMELASEYGDWDRMVLTYEDGTVFIANDEEDKDA